MHFFSENAFEAQKKLCDKKINEKLCKKNINFLDFREGT